MCFLAMMGVGQSSAEWLFLYLFSDWCSGAVGRSGRMAIFFLLFNLVLPNGHLLFLLFSVWRSKGAGSQAEWPSLLLSNVDTESVFFVVFFVVLSGRYSCCIVMFICILLFTNIPCFLNLQQNSKKRKVSHKSRLLFHFAFWYELSNFALVFFIHTCVNLCVLIICVICCNN